VKVTVVYKIADTVKVARHKGKRVSFQVFPDGRAMVWVGKKFRVLYVDAQMVIHKGKELKK
jgi:hypothetical protein